MADWNPDLYLRYADERTRAAHELLSRIPLPAPALAVDLGCGPGNSTQLLAERWPHAGLTGVDTSQAMLAAAREALPSADFVAGDVTAWRPPRPVDVIFANAVLQWVGDHETLFSRLLGELAPGGVLAVQMPDNLDEPSHRAMRETAADGPWASALADAATIRTRILPAETYYDLLAPMAASVDIWRTTYYHVLAGPGGIVEWLRATGLRPFVDRLAEADRTAFLAAYEARIARAYPVRPDGRVLLAFPRLFIVARR